MKYTYETINVLMLLIPGLISMRILETIRRKEIESAVNKLIESFIFSFLIYIAVAFIYKWEPIAKAEKVGNEITYSICTDYFLLAITLGLSVLFPLVLGAVVHNDYHMVVLRFLRVTNRTSRDTAWDDVFTNHVRFLTIHLKDGRRVTGWPEYYSNSPDEGFIYLSQASWINSDNKYFDTESHGLLINRDEMELIEFMYTKNEQMERKNE